MSDSDFNDYLKGRIVDEMPNIDRCAITSYSNANEMAEYLKRKHAKLGRNTNSLLREHIQFGKDVKRAKKLFKTNRKQWKITEKWEKWINVHAGISNSYVRRHIQMYVCVKKYSKLQNLSVTFTELCNMRKKIEEVFNRNSAMVDEWN